MKRFLAALALLTIFAAPLALANGGNQLGPSSTTTPPGDILPAR